MKPPTMLILEAGASLEEAAARTRDLRDKIFVVRMSPSGWCALSPDLLDRMMKERGGFLPPAALQVTGARAHPDA
jgi:hypothetical protein